MSTFTYQTPTAGPGGETDYKGLYNQKIVVRYGGFRMENGVLWKNRRLDDTRMYSEQDGRVIKVRDEDNKLLSVPIPVPQENTPQLYINQVQLNLIVVKPVTHFGTRLSLRLKVKGFGVTSSDGFAFTSDRTGFMRAAFALGFNWRLADRASAYHDPRYVLDIMEANCTTPLTVDQIVLGVFDPIFRNAFDDDARLVEGQTGVTDAWFQWDMAVGYLDPILDSDVLNQIWKEVEGHTPEEETKPEAAKPDTRTVAGLGKTVEEVKTAIADAVGGKGVSTLTGDHNIVPNPRVNEVYNLILQSEPGFKSGAGMLGRIKESTLVAVHETLFPSEEKELEEEAAL